MRTQTHTEREMGTERERERENEIYITNDTCAISFAANYTNSAKVVYLKRLESEMTVTSMSVMVCAEVK